jgi:hypothetical protein
MPKPSVLTLSLALFLPRALLAQQPNAFQTSVASLQNDTVVFANQQAGATTAAKMQHAIHVYPARWITPNVRGANGEFIDVTLTDSTKMFLDLRQGKVSYAPSLTNIPTVNFFCTATVCTGLDIGVTPSTAPPNQFANAISPAGALSYVKVNSSNLSDPSADAQPASGGVGSCTNKTMRGPTWNAAPTCSTVPSAYLDTSTALPNTPSDNTEYVSSVGNDANDGLSWGRAKATWFAAAEALPGGSASPPTAGSGTIYIASGARANPTTNAGMWLMCSADSSYASPPPGWLRYGGRTLANIGIANTSPGNNHKPAAGVTAGGSSTNKPAIWISGQCANNTLFKDLTFAYPYVGIRLAVDSTTGSRTTGGVQNVTFENVSVNHGANCTICGPSVDIGSGVFWVWFRDGSYTGAQNHLFNVSSAIRAAGTVTLTTSAKHLFSVGQRIAVGGYADTSWNGTFTVATVPAANQITYAQTGKPDATAPTRITGVNPIVIDDLEPAFLIDPGSGAGSGNIYLSDMVLSGGGVRFYPGNQTNGLDLNRVQTEATSGAPIIWFSNLSTTNARATNLVVNDATAPAVEVDRANGLAGSGFVVATDAGPIVGDVQCGAQCSTLPGVSPAISNPGNYLGTFYGQVDASRRNFTPTVARFTNLAGQNPASWSGGKITTGVAAPDGTTNAAQFASASGEVESLLWSGSLTTNVGDWIVACAWARSVNANGYDRNAALWFYGPSGFGLDTGTNYFAANGAGASGQWGWGCAAHKVTTGMNGTYNLDTWVQSSPVHSNQIYAPILIQITTSAGWSDNEVAEYAMHLQSYPDTASVGDVSLLRGQSFSFSSPNSNYFGKFTSAPWTADRTYTWPDVSGNVCVGASCAFTRYVDMAGISTPANPASGNIRLFADSGTGNLACRTSTGGNCLPTVGGGGMPGGSNTQLQYNNSGSLGGSISSRTAKKYHNRSINGAIPAVTSCGITSTCSGTTQYTPKIVYGTVPLTAGTVIVTGLPFTSTTSFVCTPSRSVTTGLTVTNSSASSVTFSRAVNTDTDTVSYICVGT